MITPKNNIFNACNIYILLWLFGQGQNLFLSNSFVSMLFYLPYLGMTLYYIARVFLRYRPKGVMMALSVFFSVLVIYGLISLFSIVDTGNDKNAFLLMLFASLGPIFPFYSFAREGVLTERRMLIWFFFFLVFAALDYNVNRQKVLILLAERNSQYEDVVNNSAYKLLALFPFIFLLWKKPVLQYLMIGYILYFVISGMKRGAILTAIPMIIWFVYITRSASKNHKFVLLLLTIVLIIIGWRFISQLYEQSDYFQMRVENTIEGSSSNRDWIYGTLWNHFKNNNNILQIVFGEGAYYTQAFTGLLAHNDWLELLIDCGLFGVLLYLIYWINFIKYWIKSKSEYLIYAIMGSCLLFTLIRTFFSMSFSFMPFYICMAMGFCFAQVDNKDKNNKNIVYGKVGVF